MLFFETWDEMFRLSSIHHHWRNSHVRKLPLRRIGPHTGLVVAIVIVKSSLSPFVVYLGIWRDFSITDRPAFLALDKAEGPPQKSKTSGAEVWSMVVTRRPAEFPESQLCAARVPTR
jgi:hypothetical protein